MFTQNLPGDGPCGPFVHCWNKFASPWFLRLVYHFLLAGVIFSCAGCLCVATYPRLHGGRKLPEAKEDLPYWHRLLAVVTLGVVRAD